MNAGIVNHNPKQIGCSEGVFTEGGISILDNGRIIGARQWESIVARPDYTRTTSNEASSVIAQTAKVQ